MNDYNLLKSIPNLSLNLKLCLAITHEAGWRESKTNNDHTLWTVERGNILFKVGNNEYLTSPGDTILFYPGEPYKASSDEDCQFIVNHFTLKVGNEIDVMAGLNLAGIIPKRYFKNHLSIDFGKKARTEYFPVNQEITFSMYADFMIFLSAIFDAGKEHCIRFHETTPEKGDLLIYSILEYIEENYHKDIGIKELAEFANMSEKYFIVYFRYRTGNTPKQYIVDCRMKKAAELLAKPGSKIKAVAYSLGYSDQYCFSKAFKKYYDESPTEFKNHFGS